MILAAMCRKHRMCCVNLTVLLVLYFGSPGALCFAGLVLWAHRKQDPADRAIAGQRLQAKVAILLALLAAAIVYLLIIFAEKIESIEA